MRTLTISEAKPRLGKLADAALQGKPIFLRRGREVLQLVRAVMPDPVPLLPPGALDRTQADIQTLTRTHTDDEAFPLRP